MRLFSMILGWGPLRTETELAEFVSSRPFVAFRPAEAKAGTDRECGPVRAVE